MVIGLELTYIYYEHEPWETIAGFIVGSSLALFLISFSSKTKKKQLLLTPNATKKQSTRNCQAIF